MRSLARLLIISSVLLAGCGSDSNSFSNPKDGGKNNPDAGLTGGSGNSGGASNSGGSSAKGGTGAMSMGGSAACGAGSPECPDAHTGGGATDSGQAGAASGGSPGSDGGNVDSGGCPSGTVSVGGKCLKDNLQACDKDADCGSGNCVGGACCKVACNSPGACQQLDGTVCQNGDTCVYGSQPDKTIDPKCDTGDKCTKAATCFQGACSPGDPIDCSDTDLCTIDDCDSAKGCTHTVIDVTKAGNACDDSNDCTADTCDSKVGCKHTNSDGPKAGCNDNNPCTTDTCSGGLCVNTAMDCSKFTDDCNVGVCAAGTCKAQPSNVNGACTEGLTTCDSGGKCNASGACVTTGNACGARSTACTPCTNGTANCKSGRLCTCAPATPADVVSTSGVCVANTDDCALNPCGPNSTACHDPTPDGSNKKDWVCTCAKGYTQTAPGNACSDVNECAATATNPCGAGTCVNTTGSYDCTCAAPLTKIQTSTGPQCSCNLAGTYAIVVNTTITYPAISVGPIQTTEASPPGGLPTIAWALRYNTVDATKGTVTSQTVSCGGSTPDVCDTLFGFAHAQYSPTPVYGQPAMVAAFPPVTTPLAGVVPGGSYTEPPLAVITGIKLDTDLGAWPQCAECVGPTHPAGSMCTCPGGSPFTVSNGAQWLNNPDGLGHLGFTTFAIPRGGLLMTAANPPPQDYTEPSVCPRMAANANQDATYGYAEFPGVANNVPFRAYSWHAATRLQSTFKVDPKVAGNSISAQCTLAGEMIGPDSGKPKTEARVEGCEICSGSTSTSCVAGGACTQAQSDSYDTISQTQQITAASFTLAPAPSGVGDLGAVLAMADGTAKTAAINKACGFVRAAYPAPRK